MGKCFSNFILLIVCTVLWSQAGSAFQDVPVQEKPRYEIEARNCESNQERLWSLAAIISDTKERMFVIARLGKGERPQMNRRRLHNVREYFRSYNENLLKQNNIVFAEGEPTKGEGAVEIYIGSQVYAKATFGRDENFCVDCCEWPDTRYYGRGKTKEDRRYNTKKSLVRKTK